MSDSEKKIGLLAGAGEVPAYFAKQATQRGIRITAVSFSEEIHSKLEPLVEKAYSIGIGKPGKIFKTFKDENVTDLVMLGKVDKKIIFRPSFFDLRAIKFFKSLISQEDKTLLLGVIREIEKEGLNVLDQKELLGEVFPGKGVLTERKPSIQEMKI